MAIIAEFHKQTRIFEFEQEAKRKLYKVKYKMYAFYLYLMFIRISMLRTKSCLKMPDTTATLLDNRARQLQRL